MNDCIFCQLQNNILTQTDNLIVKVDENFLVEGSILILTKEHLKCMAEISEEVYYLELEKVLQEIAVFYKKVYNKYLVWYEHGVAGQEVKHAHIVCLPIDKPVLKAVINKLKKPREVEFFEVWNEVYIKFGRYYVFNQYDSTFIFQVERSRRNCLTRIVAKRLRIDLDKEISNRKILIEKTEKEWKRWKVTV